VTSVRSADEAIGALERGALDVVLTDLNLGTPGMTGTDLLAYVKERDPSIVRMVLSGQSSADLAVRTAMIAHLYLSKPFESAHLRAQLRRAQELRALLSEPRLRALVGEKNQLPTPPLLFREVALTLAKRRAGVEEVAELIERDVAISAQLLRLACSAYFGLPRRVRTVRGAVAFLGFNTVKAVLLSAAIVEQHRGAHAANGFDIERVRRHALVTAQIARQMPNDEATRETAFTAGMLQDAGQLLLASRAPTDYARVLALECEGEPLVAAETAVFGANHANVGAYLLGIWGLPHALVRAVARHHLPQAETSLRFDAAMAVNLAEKLALDPDTDRIDLSVLQDLGVANRLPVWREAARSLLLRAEEDRP
jgi:HD-like signal output (HDOD) protein